MTVVEPPRGSEWVRLFPASSSVGDVSAGAGASLLGRRQHGPAPWVCAPPRCTPLVWTRCLRYECAWPDWAERKLCPVVLGSRCLLR